ncbi:hypothetical protein, partial [Streptomyces cinereoruber]|uniref:hypothetical protein n=1 Tax=Streptomyces cinereoruber TaxID=67260 RepID=UPI003634F19B
SWYSAETRRTVTEGTAPRTSITSRSKVAWPLRRAPTTRAVAGADPLRDGAPAAPAGTVAPIPAAGRTPRRRRRQR